MAVEYLGPQRTWVSALSIMGRVCLQFCHQNIRSHKYPNEAHRADPSSGPCGSQSQSLEEKCKVLRKVRDFTVLKV